MVLGFSLALNPNVSAETRIKIYEKRNEIYEKRQQRQNAWQEKMLQRMENMPNSDARIARYEARRERVEARKERLQDRAIQRLENMNLPAVSNPSAYDPIAQRIENKLDNNEELNFFERIMTVILDIDTDEIGEGHF